MHEYRIGTAAQILGVSPDTLRRWADSGRVQTRRTTGGHRVVEGRELARLATEIAEQAGPDSDFPILSSARNRFTGIVVRVIRDTVMAQVDIQCGPHRLSALISAEAADELELEPGVLVTASTKATTIAVERSNII